ncbi:MAG: adenosylcobinamide amidohydrolase [Pseudomonadota bacterium]
MRVELDRPWLTAEFERPLRALSWAPHRPGFVTAERVAWREVRNADLPEDLDALAWLRAEMAATGRGDAVGLLTSRDVRRCVTAQAEVEGVRACVLATVGLSNAERVGARRAAGPAPVGTINIAATLSAPLSDAALIEALSVLVQARTAAVMEHGPDLPGIGRASGTGTDCAVMAAPPGDEAFAGQHTAAGEALGAAVLDAVSRGVREWMQEREGGDA